MYKTLGPLVGKGNTADVFDMGQGKVGVSKECLADWLTVIAAARLSELNSVQIEETNIVLDFLAARGLD